MGTRLVSQNQSNSGNNSDLSDKFLCCSARAKCINGPLCFQIIHHYHHGSLKISEKLQLQKMDAHDFNPFKRCNNARK